MRKRENGREKSERGEKREKGEGEKNDMKTVPVSKIFLMSDLFGKNQFLNMFVL